MQEQINFPFHRDRWSPIVTVLTPQDNTIVNKSEIGIEGMISISENFDITSAWIELNGIKIENVKLGKAKYKSPKIDSEFTEALKDKPGLAEVFSPPGRKVYEFKEKVKLEKFGNNEISIVTQTTASSNSSALTIFYVNKNIVKKPPEVNINICKDIITRLGPKEEGKLPNVRTEKKFLPENNIVDWDNFSLKLSITDTEEFIKFVWINGGLWRNWGWYGDSKSWFGDTQFVPLEMGENKIEIKVIDIAGNIVNKTITITRISGGGK